MTETKLTFGELQSRLLQHVNWRIDNGEFTERGLARVLGISQPQMHNVRKGARRLTVALADRMLFKFGITALDLIEESEAMACLDSCDPKWRETAVRKPVERIDPRAPWRTKAG